MRYIVGALVVVFALAGVVGGAQDRSTGASGVPMFRVDPTWPRIPNNWQFGQVASVSIDEQDHVWVLQRPGTLEPAEKNRASATSTCLNFMEWSSEVGESRLPPPATAWLYRMK